jgi:hypothetical protein
MKNRCSGACDIRGETTVHGTEHEDALGATVGSVLDPMPRSHLDSRFKQLQSA